MYGIELVQIYGFFLIFVRVVTIFAIFPFFGSRVLPGRFRIGFSLLISVLLWNLLDIKNIPTTLEDYLLIGLEEILVGFVLGLFIVFLFAAFQFAGQFIGIKMGFAIVNVIDPETSQQISIISQIFYIFTVILFFILNGHALLLKALYQSFIKIPIGHFIISNKIYEVLVQESVLLFKMAVKISAPIVVTIILVNIGMGIIAKSVPQINVFIMGMPLNITAGLMTMYFTFAVIVGIFSSYMEDMFTHMFKMMNLMGG